MSALTSWVFSISNGCGARHGGEGGALGRSCARVRLGEGVTGGGSDGSMPREAYSHSLGETGQGTGGQGQSPGPKNEKQELADGGDKGWGDFNVAVSSGDSMCIPHVRTPVCLWLCLGSMNPPPREGSQPGMENNCVRGCGGMTGMCDGESGRGQKSPRGGGRGLEEPGPGDAEEGDLVGVVEVRDRHP